MHDYHSHASGRPLQCEAKNTHTHTHSFRKGAHISLFLFSLRAVKSPLRVTPISSGRQTARCTISFMKRRSLLPVCARARVCVAMRTLMTRVQFWLCASVRPCVCVRAEQQSMRVFIAGCVTVRLFLRGSFVRRRPFVIRARLSLCRRIVADFASSRQRKHRPGVKCSRKRVALSSRAPTIREIELISLREETRKNIPLDFTPVRGRKGGRAEEKFVRTS